MIDNTILLSGEYNYVTYPVNSICESQLLDLAYKTPIGENIPHRQDVVIAKDIEKVSILTNGTYCTNSYKLKGNLGEQLIEGGIVTGIVVRAKDENGYYNVKYNSHGLFHSRELTYRKDYCPHCGKEL